MNNLTPIQLFNLYRDKNKSNPYYIYSQEGMITFLEDEQGMGFDDAAEIANDPEVVKRINARAISNAHTILSNAKGRNSRELMSIINDIRAKEAGDDEFEGKYNIIIEKTEKEV